MHNCSFEYVSALSFFCSQAEFPACLPAANASLRAAGRLFVSRSSLPTFPGCFAADQPDDGVVVGWRHAGTRPYFGKMALRCQMTLIDGWVRFDDPALAEKERERLPGHACWVAAWPAHLMNKKTPLHGGDD